MRRYQKGKTKLDFTEARDSEWQWHQLGIRKSAPRSRLITTPAPHHSVFLQAGCPSCHPTNDNNQQRQSTEGSSDCINARKKTGQASAVSRSDSLANLVGSWISTFKLFSWLIHYTDNSIINLRQSYFNNSTVSITYSNGL